jgi:hypothetical protein
MKAGYIQPILRAFQARHDISSIDIKTMYKAIKVTTALELELRNIEAMAVKFVAMHVEKDEDGKPKTEFNNMTRDRQFIYKSQEDKQEYEARMAEINTMDIAIADDLKMTQHELEQFKFTFGELHLLVDLFANE